MNNPWKKHKMPPMDRMRWCDNPHDFLDFELEKAPAISSENPTANAILQNKHALIRFGLGLIMFMVFELGLISTMTKGGKQQIIAYLLWLWYNLPWTRCKSTHQESCQ